MARMQSSQLQLSDAAPKGGKTPELFTYCNSSLDVSHPNPIVLVFGKKMCLTIKSRSSWVPGKGSL